MKLNLGINVRSDTKTLREKELAWLQRNKEQLKNLAGNWIAVEGNELIAFSPDIHKVVEQVNKKGVKVPFVVYVPNAVEGETIGI